MASTLERLRFIGKCLAVAMPVAWFYWLAPFDDLVDRSGAALGGDYVMLYAAGQTVASGQSATLYDDALNQQRTTALLPGIEDTASWPFRYPPFVAAAMTPLASLPFGWSFVAFLGLNALILAIAIRSLTSALDIEAPVRSALIWAAVGWPVAIEVLIGGQTSIIALGILAAAVSLLRSGREVFAGMVIAIALYKPNILGLFAIGLMTRYPRAIIGASITGTALGVASWMVVGWDGIWEYVRLAGSLSTSEWSLETPYWKVHGLQSWIAAIAGDNARALTTGLGVSVVAMTSLVARRGVMGRGQWLSALLVANALFNPYVPIYDLVLLLPAALFVVSSSNDRGWRFAAVGYGLFFGPHLSQAISKCLQTDLQLFAILMVAGMMAALMPRYRSQPLQTC